MRKRPVSRTFGISFAALFFRVFLFSRSTGAASGGRLSGASPAVSVLLVLQAAEALFASGAAGAALASAASGAAAAPPFLCLADDMPQGQNEQNRKASY